MTDTFSEFPTIDSVEDNYGYVWIKSSDPHNYVLTEVILNPGDLLVISVMSENLLDEDMYYSFQFGYDQEPFFQKEPHHLFKVTEDHISRSIAVYIRLVRMHGNIYLPHEENDVQFRYTVVEKSVI